MTAHSPVTILLGSLALLASASGAAQSYPSPLHCVPDPVASALPPDPRPYVDAETPPDRDSGGRVTRTSSPAPPPSLGLTSHAAPSPRVLGVAAPPACPSLSRGRTWGGDTWRSDYGRTEAVYDKAGRAAEITSARDDGDGLGLWTRGRVSYTYDGEGRLVEVVLEEADAPGPLLPRSRDTYTYDVQGHLVLWARRLRGEEEWVLDERTTFAYGTGRYATQSATERWTAWGWTPVTQKTFVYEGDRLASARIDGSIDRFTYDETGRLKAVVNSWGSLDPASRVTYTYDGAGRLAVETAETWEQEQWAQPYIISFVYERSGRLDTTVVSYSRAPGVTPPEPIARTVLSYAGGYLTGTRDEYRDPELAAWTSQNQTLYTRDGGGRSTEIVYQSWVDGLWRNDWSTLFSYEGAVATLAPLPDAALVFTVGPNPARSGATVRYEVPVGDQVRLALYDALGREVAVLVEGERPPGPHAVPFDAAGLPVGVYLFRLETGGRAAAHTLTVVR